MAGESLLKNIQSQTPANPQTAEDASMYMPKDLDPQTQQMLALQKESQTPATGPLSMSDYYPGYGQNLHVGTSTGSEIGSIGIYSPGADLLPVGLMDARDLAVKKAALQRAQEIQDFKTKYQAPTTKHVAAQPKLTDMYYKGLDEWNKNGLKKYGEDWYKVAEHDTGFSRWNRSMQDIKLSHDEIVQTIAQNDALVKTGKYVKTPSYIEAEKRLMNDIDGLQKSPFNPSGHDFSQDLANFRVAHDLNNVINETVKNVREQVADTYGVTEGPEYDKIVSTKTSQIPEEVIKTLAQEAHARYYPSNEVSYDDVYKNFKAALGQKKVDKQIQIVKDSVGGDGSGYKYDVNNDFEKEPTNVNVTIQQTSTPVNKKDTSGNITVTNEAGQRKSSIETSDGLTFKKPIKVQMPIGKRVFFTDKGLIPTEQMGNKTVELGKMVIVDVNDDPNTVGYNAPVDSSLKGKVKTRKESMILGKYVEGTGKEKTEQSFFVPTTDVENALVKQRDKNGNVITGVPVDESYRRVQQYNNSAKSSKKYSEVQEKAISQGVKDNPGYSREEIINALGF